MSRPKLNYKRIRNSSDSSDPNVDFEQLQATPSTSRGPKIKRVRKFKRVPIRKNPKKMEKSEELDKLKEELRKKRNKAVRHINFKSSSESESENEDADQTKFERKTRMFSSKYPFKCDLPECEKKFKVGETQIIGVHLHSMIRRIQIRNSNSPTPLFTTGYHSMKGLTIGVPNHHSLKSYKICYIA